MRDKVTIGVIPAAGGGTRFGYLSHVLPKTLFPLYNQPILHHVIDHMIEVGIRDIYIIVNKFKDKIIDYCSYIKLSPKTKIHFIDQKKLDGLASAILLVEPYVKTKPFLVILGDDCTISKSMSSLLNFFYNTPTIAVEAIIKEKDQRILSQTNSVKLGRDRRIIEIIEKPKKPKYFYRGCGIYLFTSEIFSIIKKTPISMIRNEREITHSLQLLTQQKLVHGFMIKGINININNYDDLLIASTLIKKYAAQ
jgi:glucose-1-phosphate thymidylyltransferase